jgi:hypothetical protein
MLPEERFALEELSEPWEEATEPGSPETDPPPFPLERSSPIPPIEAAEVTPLSIDWRNNMSIVCGAMKTGKTWWLRWLFFTIYPLFNYGIVYSSKLDAWKHEYSWMPRENIINYWEDTRVKTEQGWGIMKGLRTRMQMLFEAQEKLVDKYGEDKAPHVFIIVDDPMGHIDMRYSKEFLDASGQLRKKNCALFVVVQQINACSTGMKNNAGKLVVFQCNEEELKKMHALVIGFQKKRLWQQFVYDATKNFGGVIYDRDTRKFCMVRAPTKEPLYQLDFF